MSEITPIESLCIPILGNGLLNRREQVISIEAPERHVPAFVGPVAEVDSNWVGGLPNLDFSVLALERRPRLTKDITKMASAAPDILLFGNWCNAVEDGTRARVRGFIESILPEELGQECCRARREERR